MKAQKADFYLVEFLCKIQGTPAVASELQAVKETTNLTVALNNMWHHTLSTTCPPQDKANLLHASSNIAHIEDNYLYVATLEGGAATVLSLQQADILRVIKDSHPNNPAVQALEKIRILFAHRNALDAINIPTPATYKQKKEQVLRALNRP